MKRIVSGALLAAFLLSGATNVLADNFWQQVGNDAAPQKLQWLHPAKFSVYTVNETELRLQMFTLSSDPAEGQIFTLPMPDGTTRDFKVWQSSMLPDALAAKYANIRTFTGEAVDDHNVTAKLDFTEFGFHAMIYNGDNTSFIDPYDHYNDGFYMVHYKMDETRAYSGRMKCLVPGKDEPTNSTSPNPQQKQAPTAAAKTMNGYQLRTYRLALACDDQYAIAATGFSTPTKAQALSCMTTSMNRINGIYEREFSIHMNFIPNEDTIIFVTPTGDPYYADNLNASNLLTDNQTELDAVIGNGNYDVGHVFTTGGGGLSLEGVVCDAGYKAQSETGSSTPVGDGFDVDYVAHEMGHEYGADHPFNNGTDGSCGGGNRNATTAYEPGSGSTIMAYAGICDPDDLQYHSDAYFHAISLEQIQTYITGDGDVCPVHTATGNKFVKYNSFAASYIIPYLTPFELTGPALTDSVTDSTTLYCWEEWDLGPANELVNTHASGPIFRSYDPVTSPTRVFPKVSMVLAGTLSNAGTEGNEGEKVPDVARTLTFVCTFRDIRNNYGCITIPDDEIALNAVNTGAGFAVTSQGSTGISYTGHSTQTITWNVVSTNVAPVSAANVNIYMSVDGGNTWPYLVGIYPNNGSASVTVPNPPSTSTTCRFKVKGAGNVFFNVNKDNFSVTYNSSFPVATTGVQQVSAASGDVKLYPVPATNSLHVASSASIRAVVYNSVGQQVWSGNVDGQTEISVAAWARGIYFMSLTDGQNNKMVKKFVLQ
jgi:Metallo-peptidase family M12/Secretion system C-terminal sorting domain